MDSERLLKINDSLWRSAHGEYSYTYGQCIAYEEIDLAINECSSERSLVIHLNKIIRDLEQNRLEAIDIEDERMFSGEIDAIKEFKKKLKEK